MSKPSLPNAYTEHKSYHIAYVKKYNFQLKTKLIKNVTALTTITVMLFSASYMLFYLDN